jgi:hypothetical protein
MTSKNKHIVTLSISYLLLKWNSMLLKNIKKCLNANIYSCLETSGGQSFTPYFNVVPFINTRADQKSVAAYDSSFPALVSKT